MASTVKQAKTLDDKQFDHLLDHINAFSTMPERDRLMVMLSFKGGLRAAEIAQIDMAAMTDAAGNIAKEIIVSGKIAKAGRDRTIPMNKDVTKALKRFRTVHPKLGFVAVSSADRKTQMKPNAVAVYLRRLFVNAGFSDCSSHSGRRTFGTSLARRANSYNRSLRDVQRLMGHARLDTTERYIDVASESFDLVNSL